MSQLQFRIERVRMLPAVLALFLLAGCNQSFKMGEAVDDRVAEVTVAKGKAAPAPDSRYMAYEHYVRLDASEDRVRPVYEAALAACRDAAAEQCAVLESRLNTGEGAYATLKFRARPAGIKKIIAALSEQGGVVSQSTTAEDLTGPIEDTGKKLDMLRDYRAKLEALRGRASTSIDSLIKVNKELAQVQSDIEALAGQQANLMKRVETELLEVNISSARNKSAWGVIWRSISRFGANLGDGLAVAITTIAYLLPALPILFALAWVTRWAGRRLKRGAAAQQLR